MSGRRLLAALLGVPWRTFGRPIYRRLFGRYFEAIISRCNSALGQLTSIREELTDVRRRLDQVDALQVGLDQQIKAITANHWDAVAGSRRLAAIEDRLSTSDSA